MVLNNFRSLLRGFVDGLKDKTGTNRTFYVSNTDNWYYSYNNHPDIVDVSSNSIFYYIAVGTNDTPVAASDYAIDTPSGVSIVYRNDIGLTSNQFRNVVCTYKNDNAESVTIKEMGLYLQFRYGSSTSNKASALMFRKVLDTPIVMAPGEQRAFTYIVTWNDFT